MITLDRHQVYELVDPSCLRNRIADLPDQCWHAWEKALTFSLPATYAHVRSVVIMGMGGSAIGGDLISGLMPFEKGPPVIVLQGYDIPSWVGPDTLAIASSYSGNTEETVAMCQEAIRRGAQVIAITSGGKLAKLSNDYNFPLFNIEYCGEPRSALGYSFVAPLAILSKLGLLQDKKTDLAEAVDVMRDLALALAPEVLQARNMAKITAVSLHNKVPVIYGAEFLVKAARRWKTQFNENSKTWAFYEAISELNHNSIEGYSIPGNAGDQLYVILLHSRFLDSRISVRYDITEAMLGENGITYKRFEAVGDTPLAHLLTTIMLGDYVSYYLSILHETDPAITRSIDFLKQKLTE